MTYGRDRIGLAIFILIGAGVALAADPPSPVAGFKPALPGYTFEFPRDHGSHDGFATEWWYFTGHLRTGSGHRFGFEVTFFRVGIVPPHESTTENRSAWDLSNLSLAHFAISDLDEKKFRYYEKTNRSTPYTANAREGMLDVFNEGWSVVSLANGDFRLRAKAGGDGVDLILHPEKAPAIHGENGVSVKAKGVGYASHYYSLTRLSVSGTVICEGTAGAVRGRAWMDHEFGSAALRENQQGWDWFSVQLDDQTELMLYVMRRIDGSADITSAGTLILADGSVIHIRNDQFTVRSTGRWKSPRTGATYPMGWMIDVPAVDLRITIKEEMESQELVTNGSTGVTYWEGAVQASGSSGGTPVSGEGYVEMTGYDRRFRGR